MSISTDVERPAYVKEDVRMSKIVRGNIDPEQINGSGRQGDSGVIQMAGPGGFTDGNVLIYDANGNAIDSGVAPGSGITYPGDATKYLDGTGSFTVPSGGGGSGAPWLSITDPSSISFSWRNQGSASVQSRTQSVYLLAPAASGDNIKGREISAPSTPWSITVGLIPHTHNQNFNSCGLYVSDGTKLIASPVGTGGAFGVNKYTNVTTFSGANYAAPGTGFAITPIFVKVVDDGTNLKWYWSPNGIDFHLVTSNARLDYLASVSFVGFYANSNNSSWAAACLLVSWVQGTS